MSTLTAEIRAEMARTGVTARELAKCTRLTPTTVSLKLNGHRRLYADEVEKIARRLNLTAAELYKRTESLENGTLEN